MSKPGRAQEYTAPTAEATPLQNVPPIPEPTGSASRDGAATAPPANLDGASPAATAPEASFFRNLIHETFMRIASGKKPRRRPKPVARLTIVEAAPSRATLKLDREFCAMVRALGGDPAASLRDEVNGRLRCLLAASMNGTSFRFELSRHIGRPK